MKNINHCGTQKPNKNILTIIYVVDLEDEASIEFLRELELERSESETSSVDSIDNLTLVLENETGEAFLHELEINIIPTNPLINANAVSQGQDDYFPAEIKVTVHIPEHVNPRIKRQKINRIYDILQPKRWLMA